jgi:hypothetical protein
VRQDKPLLERPDLVGRENLRLQFAQRLPSCWAKDHFLGKVSSKPIKNMLFESRIIA